MATKLETAFLATFKKAQTISKEESAKELADAILTNGSLIHATVSSVGSLPKTDDLGALRWVKSAKAYYVWNGAVWNPLVSGGGGSYVLPIATGSVLGGVLAGTDVTISGTGVLGLSSAILASIGSIAGKVTANTAIVGATKTKITYDSKGLVTGGADLSASDIPALDWSKITTGKPTTLAGYGITDALNTSATSQTKIGGLSVSYVTAGAFSAVDALSACNIYPFEILISDTNTNGDASIGANGHVLNGANDAHLTLINATGNAQLIPDKLSFGAIYLDKTRLTDLTDAGASALHYHAADRNRANHTGTQAWSTITGTPTTIAGYGITNGSTFLAGYNQTANQCAGALNSGSLQGWTKICSWSRATFTKRYADFQMFRGGRGTSSFNVRVQFVQEADNTAIADGNIAVHPYEGLSIATTDFALIYNIDSGEIEFWFYDTTTSNRQYVFKLMLANATPTLYYATSGAFPANYNSLINAFVFQPILRTVSDDLTDGGDTTLHYHASDRVWANITSKPTTLAGYGITDAQPLDPRLTALAGLNTTLGLLVQTGADTFTKRSVVGGAGIFVTNPAGTAGDITVGLAIQENSTANAEYAVNWDNGGNDLFRTPTKMTFNPSTGTLSSTLIKEGGTLLSAKYRLVSASVPWADLSGVPTSFTPAFHLHTSANISDFNTTVPAVILSALLPGASIPITNTDSIEIALAKLQAQLNLKAATATTLAGYGITDALNTSSIAQTKAGALTLATPTTTQESLILPHGTTPTTSITNGSVGTTTTGMYVRLNGSTRLLSFLEVAQTYSAVKTFSASPVISSTTASTTAGASYRRANTGMVDYDLMARLRAYVVFKGATAATAVNTITETDLPTTAVFGTSTMPANFFQAGTVLRVGVTLSFISTISSELTITLKVGSVARAVYKVIPNSTASIGHTLIFNLVSNSAPASSVTVTPSISGGDIQGTNVLKTGGVFTLATNIAQAITVSIKWAVANAGNSCTGTINYMEVV